MPEFANDDDTFAIPQLPSIGWCKRVAHAAGLWPDSTTVPSSIWGVIMRFQEAAWVERGRGNAPEPAELPPLPEPDQHSYVADSVMRQLTVLSFTADQMRAYALAAVAADRATRGKV
jgi:hypothetical protein